MNPHLRVSNAVLLPEAAVAQICTRVALVPVPLRTFGGHTQC